MLPDYVLLRPTDAPKVRLGKNVNYQLVSPTIPGEDWIMANN